MLNMALFGTGIIQNIMDYKQIDKKNMTIWNCQTLIFSSTFTSFHGIDTPNTRQGVTLVSFLEMEVSTYSSEY